MNKIKCHLAKDLLPLYIDGVLSDASARDVQAHLDACESCREEYQILTKNLCLPSSENLQEENSRVLRLFKSKWTFQKILISLISSVLAVFLFFTVREYIAEDSELFQPRTIARAGTVGTLHLGDLSNGEWTRLYFIKEDLFSNGTSYWEPYLVFDNPFYERSVINHANSATAIEMRILDPEGNVVVEPFSIEPGRSVSLNKLDYWTEYIVEYKADGDFYIFNFI